jgi:hypothetical protein
MQWKPIKGYKNYEINELGEVRSLKRKVLKILKPYSYRGYFAVELYKNCEFIRMYVHRAVLTAFVGKCPAGYQAAHLNGDKSDNRLINLRWCTPKENASHKKLHGTQTFGEKHHVSKLTLDQVRVARALYLDGISASDIAREMKVTAECISAIIKRKTWNY